jgi:hypothetical protein
VFGLKVWHNGTQAFDHVRLRVTQPERAAFYDGSVVDFMSLTGGVGEPLPQNIERDLGGLRVAEERDLQLLWRDTDQRVTAIISVNQIGDDRWESRHELDLDDESRFE